MFYFTCNHGLTVIKHGSTPSSNIIDHYRLFLDFTRGQPFYAVVKPPDPLTNTALPLLKSANEKGMLNLKKRFQQSFFKMRIALIVLFSAYT